MLLYRVTLGTVEEEKQPLQIDIGKYEAVSEFLASCKSDKTADGYKTALTRFFYFTATANPDIEFTPDKALKLSQAAINGYVLKYAMHLKKVAKKGGDYKRGEISVNSVPYYLNPLKSFFDYHDITLSWKKIRRFIPEKVQVKYHVYSREEIKRLLDAATYREKVMILILESSGMRAEAMLDLQIQDFEIIDKEEEIGHFVVYARSPVFYHTFCTPECTRAIKFYLQWRLEMGEVEEGKTLSPTAPLIRDHIVFKGSKQARTPVRISYNRLHEIMIKLLRNANIDRTKSKLQPNHSYRKFLNTAVANAKANPLFKEIMMGHSIKLDNTYYDKNNPESIKALFDEYIKAVDTLTINDEHRLKRQVVKMKKELDDAAPKEVVANLSMQNRALQDRLTQKEREYEERLKRLEAQQLGTREMPPEVVKKDQDRPE